MNQPIVLAGCVLLDDYGRLLLLHRNTDKYQHWEMPGGKVEADETIEAAAVREIAEELGLPVALTAKLGAVQFEDRDQLWEYHWFQADVQAGEPHIMEPETFDDLDYFDIEDLPSLSLSSNMLILEAKLVSGEVVLAA